MKKIEIILVILYAIINICASWGWADYPQSMDYFRQAQEFFEKGQYKKALNLLDKAIVADSENEHAYVLRGEIFYLQQDIDQAEVDWERALELNPRFVSIKRKLERLRREGAVEEKLESAKEGLFEIRFEGEGRDYDIEYIKGSLKQAYRKIGRDFNYYPTRKIAVILYPSQDFYRIRRTPGKVLGLYDGKVRLPVYSRAGAAGQSSETEDIRLRTEKFKKILWHEYTHALTHDLTRGRCPIWLNEGLAVYEEAKVAEPDLNRLKGAVSSEEILPILSLFYPEKGFKDFEIEAALFYQESYSLVDYIVGVWGFSTVRRILQRVGQGQDSKEVLEDELSLKIGELERRWIRRLKNTGG